MVDDIEDCVILHLSYGVSAASIGESERFGIYGMAQVELIVFSRVEYCTALERHVWRCRGTKLVFVYILRLRTKRGE